jgi:hypothetical protein
MCFSCGCNDLLESDHHDPRNITTATLQAAADAAKTDIGHVVSNIVLALSHYDPNVAAMEKETLVDGQLLMKAGVDEDHFALFVAYSPWSVPLRGADKKIDAASPRTLERGCWRFMANGAKPGIGHKPGGEDSSVVVENYIYRNPIPWVIKHPDGTEKVIRIGDWLIGFILDDETWADLKAGKYTGISMQGGAQRGPVTAETLARLGGRAA